MKKLLCTSLLAVLAFLPTGSAVAQEASSSAASDQQIVDRCVLSQNYLSANLRRRDLRGRVDRLQAYRYMYQRLDVYVSRLEHNRQPEADNLRASADTFAQAIERFKRAYEQYDIARDGLTSLAGCAERPAEFRDSLATARQRRQTVHSEVIAIQALLSDTIRPQLQAVSRALTSTDSKGSLND